MNNLGGSGARAGPLPNAAPLEPPRRGREALRWALPVSVALTQGIPLVSFPPLINMLKLGGSSPSTRGRRCALAPPSTAEPPALPPNRSPGGTGQGGRQRARGTGRLVWSASGERLSAFRHVNPTLGPNGWQAGMAGAGARGRTGHPRQQRRKREQTLHVFRERPDAGPASLQPTAPNTAHKTGLGAVAHLVGPGDPGGADKDFWVRPPPSPGGGGGEEAGEPCREPPVDGTEPSQPASQRATGRWRNNDGQPGCTSPVVVGAGPQPTRPRAGAARPRGPRKAAPPTAPAARTPQSLPRFRGREPERQGQTKQHTTPNPPKNATRNGALAATRAARLGSGGKQASKHKREPAGGELAKPVARGRGGTLAGPVSFSTCLTHGLRRRRGVGLPGVSSFLAARVCTPGI
ncbi:hypothetical protein C7M84_018145 [Penaeus vannamei]|uniref:Uncharacterized protein n=1 Tax=Penaeus vannamei TaxID=6689 RepID=A0A423SIB1_PENVA|nr:hypothetical protein C7M84_018145 [Penaeus vannamei]